jgi:hypothetical protein
LIDELPTEQGPEELKLTNCPFAELLDSAVAVTIVGCEPPSVTELGRPRTIVWLTASTAGADGALERDVGSMGTGSSVVAIV